MLLFRLAFCAVCVLLVNCVRPAYPAVNDGSSLEFVQQSTGFRRVHVAAGPAAIDVDAAVHLPSGREDVEQLLAKLTNDLVKVSLESRGFTAEPRGRADAILEVRVDAWIGDDTWAEHRGDVPVQRCLVPLSYRKARCGARSARPDRPSSATLHLSLRDAHTGRSLWRGRIRVPAHVLDREQVRRAVQRTMTAFPFRDPGSAAAIAAR